MSVAPEEVPFSYAISSFAPEPFELARRLEALIRPMGDHFVASFVDANISASGDTPEEAVENLKSLILDEFESLENAPSDSLGPLMQTRRSVLRECLRRKGEP